MDSAPVLTLIFRSLTLFASKVLYLFSHDSYRHTCNTSSQLIDMSVGIGVDPGGAVLCLSNHPTWEPTPTPSLLSASSL